MHKHFKKNGKQVLNVSNPYIFFYVHSVNYSFILWSAWGISRSLSLSFCIYFNFSNTFLKVQKQTKNKKLKWIGENHIDLPLIVLSPCLLTLDYCYHFAAYNSWLALGHRASVHWPIRMFDLVLHLPHNLHYCLCHAVDYLCQSLKCAVFDEYIRSKNSKEQRKIKNHFFSYLLKLCSVSIWTNWHVIPFNQQNLEKLSCNAEI